jgi:hypothetical protein
VGTWQCIRKQLLPKPWQRIYIHGLIHSPLCIKQYCDFEEKTLQVQNVCINNCRDPCLCWSKLLRLIVKSFQQSQMHREGVTTLALDSRPRLGLAKVWAKSETGSHISCYWECGRVWGNEPHTPKWAPTWRIVVPMDSRIFWERLQGSKPIGSKSSLYHWKNLGT